MKINTILISIFIFIALSSSTFSQDTNSAKYFPLNVGNVWIYSIQSFPPLQFPFFIYKIEGDTLLNNHRYFIYNTYNVTLLSSKLIRYDSLNGNLLVYSSTGGCSNYGYDKIIDSLSSTPGNLVTCQLQSIYTRLCLSVSDITVFNGYQTQQKEFKHDGLTYGVTKYAKNFGIISSCSGEPPPCSSYENLKGCVINGVVYGDTVLTNVHQISSAIPESFSLSQNYPNPFNPKTIINYELGITNYVSVKVFDALGKVVATLVNEKQNAGTYSIDFNGEGLPSGVYFYKLVVSSSNSLVVSPSNSLVVSPSNSLVVSPSNSLEAGSFVETKRMVLLK